MAYYILVSGNIFAVHDYVRAFGCAPCDVSIQVVGVLFSIVSCVGMCFGLKKNICERQW